MSGSSLFQPSQEGFVGLWAPPVAGKLQFALKDIVQIYNSVVRQRQTGLQKSGVLASSDISKFQKHVQNFLGAWKYCYDKIKDLHCIQPVHENADAIKPQFLAKWDERKSANAQDEFIREQYVLSSQLSHVTEAISFADHYLQLYERAKGFAGFPKSKFNTAEEVETLHNILIAEYKYLAGCDVEWLSPPSFVPEGRNGDDAAGAAPAGAAGAAPAAGGTAATAAGAAPEAAPRVESAPERDAALGHAEGLAGQLADIALWGITDDSFPLSHVNLLVFDHNIGRGALRYYHAAAILLFYQNKRTEAQEKAFMSLSEAWGHWFGRHITDEQLRAPPTAGPCAYSKAEVKKCADMREALIISLTDEMKATLELPVRELRKRQRGDSVEDQALLLR